MSKRTQNSTTMLDEEGYRLPDGWRRTAFSEVASISAPIVDPTLPDHRDLPHVNGENIESGACRLKYLHTAAEEGMISGKYLFEPGDVLYSKLRPYLRKALHADFRGLCSADMYPIKVDPQALDGRFTAWLLVSDEFTRYASEESQRSRMPKLNRKQLFRYEIPLPPLLEQRRIAEILNEQMSAVEKARAAAEEQLKAIQALPSAYLREVFTSPEAQKWPVKRLEDVGHIVSGIALGRKLKETKTRKVPYLRVANVKDGHLDLSNVYEVDATESEIQKLRLQYGDMLLTEGGDRDKLGRGTFWRRELRECIHQNHIFRVRLDMDSILPEFVSAQIASPYGKAYFLAHAKQTTGIATINQRVLSGFPLMLPKTDIQRRIADRLSRSSGSAARLLESHLAQLDAINKLPAALLRQAFRGEL